MKEILYELLSYEPMEEITGLEKKVVLAILDNNGVTEDNIYYQLIKGFHDNYMSDSLIWLRDWVWEYLDKQDGEFDEKIKINPKARANYPVILKKICYYYMLVYGKSSTEIISILNVSGKGLIGKWNLYAEYRRDSEQINDVDLPISRSGKKAKYLLNFIQKAYYESYRQTVVDEHVAKKMKDTETIDDLRFQERETRAYVEDLPIFIDCFAGTGLVAASMNTDNDKKVVNELDPVVSTFMFVITHYWMYFSDAWTDFHNKIHQGYFDKELAKLPKGFCKGKGRVEPDYYTSDYVNELQEEWSGGKSPERLELLKNIRNAWFYSQYIMLDDRAKCIRDVCVFNYYKVDLDSDRLKEICKVLCYFVYYSSAPAGKGGILTHTKFREKEYYKILKNTFIEIPKLKENKDIVNWLAEKPVLQAHPVPFSDYVSALTYSIIGRLSFDELFPETVKGYWQVPNDKKFEDRVFYYYDSPYWLTTQYAVGFTDERHKKMIDSIRGNEFKWLFSMQYNKATKRSTSKDSGKRTNKETGEIKKIKDYYTYYSGFLAEFKEEKNVYTSTYNPSKDYSDVYVIFIDRSIRPKGVGKTADTKEMFVTNVDCRRVTPLKDLYIQLSMKKFLEYIVEEPEADYDDIVEFAKQEYKNELRP